jgi:hypothetical protein
MLRPRFHSCCSALAAWGWRSAACWVAEMIWCPIGWLSLLLQIVGLFVGCDGTWSVKARGCLRGDDCFQGARSIGGFLAPPSDKH